MAIALLRVDERLIHGQVTVGWGARLSPRRYLVVDDDLALTPWEQELIALSVPEGTEVGFLSVVEARARLPRLQAAKDTTVLLTRDLEHMVRLARGGRLRGMEVNLGGLHHAPGREEVLPYLFLGPGDRDRIRELDAEGARVSARDLPASPRRTVEEILD